MANYDIPTSFRLPKNLIEEARQRGINVRELFEQTLMEKISEARGTCACCGKKITRKKRVT